MIIKSKLKTDELGFNNLLSRKTIQDVIKELKLKLAFVDSDKREYWENNDDTMVFYSKDKAFEAGLCVGILTQRLNADEFDYLSDDNQAIIRLWWD